LHLLTNTNLSLTYSKLFI